MFLKTSQETGTNHGGVNAGIQDIYKYLADPNYALYKPAQLEDRSRRKNLRIVGIKEEKCAT